MAEYPRPTAKDLKRLDELIYKLSNTQFMNLIKQLEEEE